LVKIKKDSPLFLHSIPMVLQIILNVSLVLLAVILCFLLIKELIIYIQLLMQTGSNDYTVFLEGILTFFLYFEFIAMIVKYFEEQYHFPLRYFIYIGITAMMRVIIVEHSDPLSTLLYALVILVLIIGYFIMNLTPRDRPESNWFFKK
jgi:protein PsiE